MLLLNIIEWCWAGQVFNIYRGYIPDYIFFSVTLVHFSDQKLNSQNNYFYLQITESLLHIIKTVSHSLSCDCFGTFIQLSTVYSSL